MFAAYAGADLAHAAVDALQAGRDGAEQAHASSCHLHAAGVAVEKLSAHFFFKRLNLAGYGALRERHFFSSGAEVEMTRYGFKSAKVASADRAGAQMGLGMQHIVLQFMRLMNE